MIRSMTGYGEASAHEAGAHYFLEVRSLNGKYFKASIRLPEELEGLEPELEAELRRRLTRGSITLIGTCSDSSGAAAHRVNRPALEAYLKQLHGLPVLDRGGLSVDAGALLSLPGVLQPPDNGEERIEKTRPVFLKLLEQACAQVSKMRQREGGLLVADLMNHHALIVQALARVAARAPRVVEDYQRRLKARVESLLQDAKVRVEPVDLIREVAVYAEKSDIAEEVARLGGHLDQFKALLTTDDGRPMGRTLDFLTQEMLREANTMASKSGDAEISRDIVEIKGAIDRIKEQVQNVE